MRVVSILATLLLGILLTMGLAACGGGGPSDLNLGGTPTTIVIPTTGVATGAPAPATPATVLPPYASLIALPRGAKIAIYSSAKAVQPARVLSNPVAVPADENTKVAQVFRVLAQQSGGWVQVQLPTLGKPGTAWVRNADVTITQVAYRMRVVLGTGQITLFGSGQVVYHGPIAVSAAARTTPSGHYFLRASFTAPASRTTTSPFVYGLIKKLAVQVPLGTPVDVVH